MNKIKGFAFAEVLVALAIVAFALVPLLSMMRSIKRQVAFSDYHVFWQVRAMRVLEHYRLSNINELRFLLKDGNHRPAFPDTPIPPEYAQKLRKFEERVVLDYDEDLGCGTLTAIIVWSFPTDRKGKHRTYKLSCIVSDNDRALKAREELAL